MATRNYINLDDCIRELNRIHSIMSRNYPAQVEAGKIDPYTADNRIKVIYHLREMCYKAKNAGDKAAKRKLNSLLKQSI